MISVARILGIEMKKGHRSVISRLGVQTARALASMLLLGIVYSATFGTIHSHANALLRPNVNLSGSVGTQAGVAEMPFGVTSDSDECLTCVLHRQFSSSTVHTPVFLLGTVTEIVSVPTPVIFYHSDPTRSRPLTRLRGRAPPRLA
jgi:hypothetical protein